VIEELDAIHKHWSSNQWWSTEAEKDFLKNIGTFSKAKDDRRIDKAERRFKLLVNYRASVFKRKNWGSINAKEILAYVDVLIMEEKNDGEKL
jgi:hypothetical protein